MTYPSDFSACLDFVWQPQRDGRWDDSAPDEGWTTILGVIQRTWLRAYEDRLVLSPDINTAKREDCRKILEHYYWTALRCGEMAPGVGLMMFNDAMLSGPGHAGKMLQRIVGATVDGVIGPESLRLARAFGDKALIDALWAADQEFYKALEQERGIKMGGWHRRADEARAAAYRMAGLEG